MWGSPGLDLDGKILIDFVAVDSMTPWACSDAFDEIFHGDAQDGAAIHRGLATAIGVPGVPA